MTGSAVNQAMAAKKILLAGLVARKGRRTIRHAPRSQLCCQARHLHLQALKGSAEEKALIKRCTAEPNAQEDQLASQRKAQETTTSRKDTRRVGLTQLLQQLQFTVDACA
jgi:hypothetical protein